ncbi:MAG: hypothetical protein ABIQ16_19845 [Polyangiaceae bacterium]
MDFVEFTANSATFQAPIPPDAYPQVLRIDGHFGNPAKAMFITAVPTPANTTSGATLPTAKVWNLKVHHDPADPNDRYAQLCVEAQKLKQSHVPCPIRIYYDMTTGGYAIANDVVVVTTSPAGVLAHEVPIIKESSNEVVPLLKPDSPAADLS